MPRKSEDQTILVPEADAVVRATDFFKPAWEVPEARASAAGEAQRRNIPERGRLDG
jgi:hypothetical protein